MKVYSFRFPTVLFTKLFSQLRFLVIDYCIAVGVHVYDMGSKKVNSLVAVEVGITDHVDKGRINGDAVFQISSLQP